MKDNICINCKYWEETETTPPPTVKRNGECRRYAPKMSMGVGTGFSEWEWPKTWAEDWCGEFANKEATK